MLPFLRLGPLLIQLPGLVLLAGVWGATILVEREALRLKLNASAAVNLILYGLLGGLIGARLVFVAQHLDAYLANPISIVSLSGSTLDRPGGFVAAVVVMVLFGRRQHLPLRPTLDALAPGLAVLLVAGGIANLLSGNAYGSPTQLPWAIYLWDAYRHPTQIYETVAALVILIIWKVVSPPLRGSGRSFLIVVALSAAARIFLEAFRGDSQILPGGFRAAQVVSLIILTATIYLMNLWSRNGMKAIEEEQVAAS
jgi:prolipoprotein diacylglyceryl transferase